MFAHVVLVIWKGWPRKFWLFDWEEKSENVIADVPWTILKQSFKS